MGMARRSICGGAIFAGLVLATVGCQSREVPGVKEGYVEGTAPTHKGAAVSGGAGTAVPHSGTAPVAKRLIR